ncbi:hypothetical protein Pan153_29220 [Gimesia panareensis]|uniref:Uncharacterized protein n=1 Tax=Gimesia panareensis TaxID=2527978 RepID=A0A518FPR6_9PLAN|nr:DUF2262 domain-containing protein [Gimesia panareensis]QDV18265.1 hypothetical protein Pan153_29220 [Gimesia panareensis]
MNDQASNSSSPDDPFAERRRIREAMYAAAPVVDVIGIFISGGGGHTEADGQFNMTLKFHGWKMPSGKLHASELSIDYKSSREKCDTVRESLEKYNIYRIKAKVLLASEDFDWDEAELVEFVGADTSDSELSEYLVEIQKPVTYQDPQLGVFTLDRDYDFFQAKTPWNGQEIELTLNVKELDENNAALKAAHELWSRQADWDQRVRQYLEQEMLPVKNDSWRDDGEAEVGAAEFHANTELESILVNDNGSFEFWFDDGEMFGYHMLYCRGELTRGFFQASLG